MAVQPPGTSVVELYSVNMAGPFTIAPGLRRSRSYTGVRDWPTLVLVCLIDLFGAALRAAAGMIAAKWCDGRGGDADLSGLNRRSVGLWVMPVDLILMPTISVARSRSAYP